MAIFKASKDHNQVYRTASEISDKSGQLLGRTWGQDSYCLKWSRELVHFASQLPSFLLTSAFTSCWLELRVLPFLHRQRIPGAWGTKSLYCLQLQIFKRTGHGNTGVPRPIHFWVIYLAIWREYSLAEGREEHHSRLLCERNKRPRELREHSRILPTSWSQSIHSLTSDWEENYSQLGKEVTSVFCMSRSHLIPFCLLQIILLFQSVCKCEREELERDMDWELFAASGLGHWRRGLTHPSFLPVPFTEVWNERAILLGESSKINMFFQRKVNYAHPELATSTNPGVTIHSISSFVYWLPCSAIPCSFIEWQTEWTRCFLCEHNENVASGSFPRACYLEAFPSV